jgi:starch phosphorylase
VLSSLRDLALDLRWTWSHEADDLWGRIDPGLWEQSHNPWTLLQNVTVDRLNQLSGDAQFAAHLQDLVAKRDAYRQRETWFGAGPDASSISGVAYFSMEFGLGDALPLYAGGLGVLAGDMLKTASDLGAPVVGVGLLFQEGYFRQVLDADGVQREAFPYNEPATLPIEPAMVDGAWLRVRIELPGRPLHLRVWRASIGRVSLYLLDSNDTLNIPFDRSVTGQLYGGDVETRLLQELALGVGGWRALEALGRQIDVCHINEGHAAFAVIERANQLARRSDLTFDQALWATRAGNVFTTHTPVAAGFDQFDPALIRKYLPALDGLSAPKAAKADQILGLGRADPSDETEPFNMAFLAVRGSATSLAVSRLHGSVSRNIFQPLFPRWPEAEIPVGHVTNGVHTATWDSEHADRLWTEACGKERWLDGAEALPGQIAGASDEAIWEMRGQGRRDLVRHVRLRLASHLGAGGQSAETVAAAHSVFDPNVLTLGFARRFTEYKRPNLLLHDPERLTRILLDEQRPVQIVVAGKAHPADAAGKEMIRQWIALARSPKLRRRIVFLEDYDLGVAQELVQGVDVWINTPRRPWEACGTSGMKVLVNGGLNCSVLDGWWAEAYEPGVGWSIGSGVDAQGTASDGADAEETYDLIERQIAPEFYDRDPAGLPRAWIARVRRSMSSLTPQFSSIRMMHEYFRTAYAPAAAALRRRQADGYGVAKGLSAWSDLMIREWPSLHVGPAHVVRGEDGWSVTASVLLGEFDPDDVRVELYVESAAPAGFESIQLARGQSIAGTINGFIYSARPPATFPAETATVRVVPHRPEATTPAELALIAWQQ